VRSVGDANQVGLTSPADADGLSTVRLSHPDS
jgi:hypothetical protein